MLIDDINGYLKFQQEVHAAGDSILKYYDPQNTHPYSELEITEDSTGKVTAAKPKLDGQPSNNVDFSAVGQVLGSALGRALAPNNQFVQIGVGTVAGAVGQKLAQAFSASLLTNGATFDLSSAFADFDISLAGAGAGSVASFLTAELGHALGLTGFNEQLFNASIGSAASAVANKIATEMLSNGLSFEAAIGTINFASAATSAGYGVSGLLGGYLGRELVPAQTHEGAVGGQLLGAVGSAIALSASIAYGLGTVLNFIMPGIGSLVGTIIGTLVGDALGSHPHPAAVDLIDQAGALYGYVHSQVSASDGGDWSIPDQMAPAVVGIVNAYLHAVNGIVLDHSKQTQIGYVTDPDFRYISGWAPTHNYSSFIHPDDAVHAAALDLLQHSEVIGGDLILKRAHQNSASNVPQTAPAGGGAPSEVSSAEQLVTMSADLRVAQDYENYLNNREAINALMAANPESAFTAGWIATFARVNDLGLNHVNASDTLGGLVGFLDSVGKAGLGAGAANATVTYGGGWITIVEVRVANGTEVPGSLSVFADHVSQSSDATATTVRFVFDNGLGGNGHAILIGGASDDVITAGNGFDFVDGGAGNDSLLGEAGNDILRGGKGWDSLQGGAGNDAYVFNRGDSADLVYDDYRYMEADSTGSVGLPGPGGGGSHEVHPDAGKDSLVFGPGIAVSDVAVRLSADGQILTVGVRDAAHQGVPVDQLADRLDIQNWNDPYDRIESFVFADGTALDVGAALGAYQVPFGAGLSGRTVAENSALGKEVGTVAGFDLLEGAALTYSLADSAGGRFAIDASTGVITVAAPIDYEATTSHSHQITVRTADQYGNVFVKPFTIAVTDVYEAPTGATLSGSSVAENSPNDWVIGTVTGVDPDPAAVLTYSLLDNAAGRFAINAATGAITVANGALLDYESATSHAIKVRTADQQGHVFDKSFTIAVTDVYDPPMPTSSFFAPAVFQLATFAPGTGGWSSNDAYPRKLADVNGDGMADIVGFGSAGVNVSLATGGGAFGTPSFNLATFGADSGAGGWSSDDLYPRQLADVNGDGMADIVGFGTSGVYVSLATGGGSFGPASFRLASFGADSNAGGWSSDNLYPRQLADINGDGMADIVGFGTSGVYVALATGGGSFGPASFRLASFGADSGAGGWSSNDLYPRQLADVNGDGRADIVGFGTSGVYVALATGGGSFGPASLRLAAFGTYPSAGGWSSNDRFPRELADVNGDGKIDIVGFADAGVVLALGNGDGSFQPMTADLRSFSPGAGGWGSNDTYPRHLADINRDGTADIVGFGHDGVYAALSIGLDLHGGTGNDTLQGSPRNDTLHGGAGNDTLVGDGGPDILAGGGGNDTLTGGPGNDRFIFAPGDGSDTITDFAAGALTDDRIDLTAYPRFKMTGILNRTTQAGVDTVIDFGGGDKITLQQVDRNNLNIDDFIGVRNVTVGDFSGDGKSDLLFLNNTSHGVAVWQMNGIQRTADAQVGIMNAAGGWRYVDVADFNGDGKADLLFQNDITHGIAVWQMNGTQLAGDAQVAIMNAAGGWHFVDIADFNGDGKSDLLFQNDTTHGVAVWQMDGLHIDHDGQVGIMNAAGGWTYADKADFNGDGKTDLLFQNNITHGVAVWQMDGTQRTADAQVGILDAAAGWRYARTGDFNGDGKTDLLMLNDTIHGIAIWQMNGTQGAANAQVGTFNAAGGWRFVDVADFNGDGKSDLLFLNDTTHGVAVWQMDGAQVTAAAQVAIMNAAGGWRYENLGDFNGDGKADLLFQNDITHGVAVWEMNGTQRAADGQVGIMDANSGWHMVV